MFRLNPCEPSFSQEASFRFVNEITVATKPEKVFEVISDGKLEAEWFPDFKSCEWLTPAPHGVGSIRRYKLTYMTIIERFTVWQSGQRLVFFLSECSLPLMTRFMEDYTITPMEDGTTRLTWQVSYSPTWWLRPIHPILRPYFKRDFSRAAANLELLLRRLASATLPESVR
jgi:hypothetical protein